MWNFNIRRINILWSSPAGQKCPQYSMKSHYLLKICIKVGTNEPFIKIRMTQLNIFPNSTEFPNPLYPLLGK